MIDCRKIADNSGDAVQLENMVVQEQRRTIGNASSESYMRGEDISKFIASEQSCKVFHLFADLKLSKIWTMKKTNKNQDTNIDIGTELDISCNFKALTMNCALLT